MFASIVLLVLWIIFGLSHSGLSGPKVRTPIVDKIGEIPFKILYSVISLILIVPLLGYFAGHLHSGPVLWDFGDGIIVRVISVFLVVIGINFWLESKSSSDFSVASIRGARRVTRHPFTTGFGFFALGHILINGHLFDVIGFSGFCVYAAIASNLQDKRRLAEYGDSYRAYMDETSFLPFGAIISGRQKFVLGEFSKLKCVVAVIAFAFAYYYHAAMLAKMSAWPLASGWTLPVKAILFCHAVTGLAAVAALFHCLFWALQFKKGNYRQSETQKKMANIACGLVICTVVTGFFMLVPFTDNVQPFLVENGHNLMVKLFNLKFFWGVVVCVLCLATATYRGSFDPKEDPERLGAYIKYTRTLLAVSFLVAAIGLMLAVIKPV